MLSQDVDCKPNKNSSSAIRRAYLLIPLSTLSASAGEMVKLKEIKSKLSIVNNFTAM